MNKKILYELLKMAKDLVKRIEGIITSDTEELLDTFMEAFAHDSK